MPNFFLFTGVITWFLYAGGLTWAGPVNVAVGLIAAIVTVFINLFWPSNPTIDIANQFSKQAIEDLAANMEALRDPSYASRSDVKTNTLKQTYHKMTPTFNNISFKSVSVTFSFDTLDVYKALMILYQF